MTHSEYNQVVQQYSDHLYRFLRKSLKDEDVALDLVQDTFETLWLNRDQVNKESAKSWLFKVGYRRMIDYIRKQKNQVQLDAGEVRSMSVSGENYRGLKSLIDKALTQLNETQRTTILLRDYEGYDYRSIGEIMGMSESSVKITLFRARQKIKNYIGTLDKVL